MLSLAKLTDPDRNAAFATAGLIVSFLCFAYSTRYGPGLILLFYAAWLPLVVLDPRLVLVRPAPLVVMGTFAAFATLSVLWSAALDVSARAAVQYLTCLLAAAVAARILSTRTLTMGGAIAVSVVTSWSVVFGRSSYDPIDASYTFVGLFGSKNQLGFYASIGVMLAAARLLIGPRPVTAVLGMAALMAFNGAVVVASGSATSMLTLAAGLGALAALRGLTGLPARMRPAIVVAMLLAGAVALAAALWAGALDAVLGLFGKDATLTGRTYLWSEGIRFGDEAPWLGVGYQAWWVRGFAEAERLWSEFYISSRSGFHFHNTFIQLYVDLGIAGLGLYVGTVVVVAILALRRVCRTPGHGPLLDASVLLVLVLRAFVEVDTLQPYTLGTFLFYLVAVRVAGPAPVARPASAGAIAMRSMPYPASGVARASM